MKGILSGESEGRRSDREKVKSRWIWREYGEIIREIGRGRKRNVEETRRTNRVSSTRIM